MVGSDLPWVLWSCKERWLPAIVHASEAGFNTLESFRRSWLTDTKKLAKASSRIEHLVLVFGLVLRDITSVQFSVADPDEVDNIPFFCSGEYLSISYAETICTSLQTILDRINGVRERTSITYLIYTCSNHIPLIASPVGDPTDAPGGTSSRPQQKKKRKRAGGEKKKGSRPQRSQEQSKDLANGEEANDATPSNLQHDQPQVTAVRKKVTPKQLQRGRGRSDALSQTFTQDELREIDATVKRAKGKSTVQSSRPLVNTSGLQAPKDTRLQVGTFHVHSIPPGNHFNIAAGCHTARRNRPAERQTER